MQTAIGVFSKRENAENAVKLLLERQVPGERIVFLTRSEAEAHSVSRQLGSHTAVPHLTELTSATEPISANAAAPATFAISGVGAIFAAGPDASSFLGSIGTGTGPAGDPDPAASSTTGSLEDLALFRRVLNDGNSVVVVRTDSPQVASRASAVLDQLGIRMSAAASPKNSISSRQVGSVVIIDIVGRIVLGGTAILRETIRVFIEQGKHHILLNLESLDYIDSVGLGELVRTHVAVRSCGGQLKLVKPTGNINSLLKVTRLDTVFEIEPDESTALRSLQAPSAPASTT